MFWVEHEMLSLIVQLCWPIIFIGAVCLLEWIDDKSDKFHEFMERTADAFGFGYSNRKRR